MKVYEVKDQKDREVIGMIEGVGGIAMMPLMLDMGSALLSKVLTLNGMIKGPWAAGVNGLLRSPFRALRDTELRDWRNFGTRVDAKRVEFNAREGVKNAKLEERFAKNEHKLFADKPEAKASRIGEWFERQLSKVTKGGPLKWLDDKVAEFARWRHKRLLKSAVTQAEGLAKSIETMPARPEQSWLGKMRKSPVLDYDEAYKGNIAPKAGAMKAATTAKDLSAATEHFIEQGARVEARRMTGAHNHGLVFGHRQAARHVDTAVKAAIGYEHIGNGEGSAIAKTLRALPKGLGKASLLHVAFGAGAALLVAAKFMDGGRTNRLEGNLIKDFAGDIYGVAPEKVTQEMLTGVNAHPLVAQAAKAALKAKNGRGAHNALHASFEVANVATLKGLGAGGMLLMPWYGMGPGMPGLEQMSQNILIGENSALLSYQQLRDAEQGKIQLAQGDAEKCVGSIIASIPAIANHHGFDNRQVRPMAEYLVAQGLPVKALLETIANPEKMVALSKTVQKQLDVKAAEEKAVKQTETRSKAAKFTDKHQPRAHAGSHAAAVEAEHAAAATQKPKLG
jgi:hypothetical protein